MDLGIWSGKKRRSRRTTIRGVNQQPLFTSKHHPMLPMLRYVVKVVSHVLPLFLYLYNATQTKMWKGILLLLLLPHPLGNSSLPGLQFARLPEDPRLAFETRIGSTVQYIPPSKVCLDWDNKLLLTYISYPAKRDVRSKKTENGTGTWVGSQPPTRIWWIGWMDDVLERGAGRNRSRSRSQVPVIIFFFFFIFFIFDRFILAYLLRNIHYDTLHFF